MSVRKHGSLTFEPVQRKYERDNDTQAYLHRMNERANATPAYLPRKGDREATVT